MNRNKDLHNFLLTKAKDLTEKWYESLDKTTTKGVYASSDPQVIKTLKQQNYDFHLHLCEVFVKEEQIFFAEFEDWILTIAQDEQHLNTPMQFTLKEFFRVQEQYLDFINEFVSLHKGIYKQDTVDIWNRVIIRAFSEVMIKFVDEHQKFSEKRLQAQQEMIQELSSPVIVIGNHTALLPLVGDIDTRRAKLILELSLEQCSQKGVNHLFIDLSGVVMIDTMVAHELFQLMKALKLIGVKTTLSGLRPEIAQTAIQLGINFEDVAIKSTLAQAISSTPH